MIASFAHGVEHIAEFDYITTPAAVADVDTSAGGIVNRAMPDCDSLTHGDFNTGRLFLDNADMTNDAVFH